MTAWYGWQIMQQLLPFCIFSHLLLLFPPSVPHNTLIFAFLAPPFLIQWVMYFFWGTLFWPVVSNKYSPCGIIILFLMFASKLCVFRWVGLFYYCMFCYLPGWFVSLELPCPHYLYSLSFAILFYISHVVIMLYSSHLWAWFIYMLLDIGL